MDEIDHAMYCPTSTYSGYRRMTVASSAAAIATALQDEMAASIAAATRPTPNP
jgi:hypothetical protein